jgi:hypothetical protein
MHHEYPNTYSALVGEADPGKPLLFVAMPLRREGRPDRAPESGLRRFVRELRAAGGGGARDDWTLATIAEISALRGRKTEGRRALSTAVELRPQGWMTATTADNLEALTPARPLLGRSVDWVADAIDFLRSRR